MTAGRWAGVPDLLSRLEDLELPLLSWGVVDGFLSKDDVETAIETQLDEDAKRPGADLLAVDDYLDHLIDGGLLFRLPEGTPKYRTRIGESLRLLRQLRQLFPPRDLTASGWWRQASPLVADYRLRVAPRRYPKRSISVSSAIAQLSGVPGWTARHEDTLTKVIGSTAIAKFQLDATASILAAIGDDFLSGRIVTAGTGSGKTLAFYLPALMDIAATVDESRLGPHTLALYPRVELLRDQAREALRVVSALGALDGAVGRWARIGLLYGNTPTASDLERPLGHGESTRRGWRRTSAGWASPYFPCPIEACAGQLIWRDTDRRSGRECLACDQCGYETQPGVLALTRDSMTSTPPDILFSSTEMLNKQATSARLGRLLGWKGPNGIRLVLLDEVHTYSGVHGAQVALTLRRWRHANRQWGSSSPVIVGLSATLRDAGNYFAALTGAERANVEVIAPEPIDLVPISREYGIVLRGDPVSGAALLSTTIQTLMLLSRTMDNAPGIFGSTVFAFTDDLDVINRLYDNLRDAEGALPRGRAGGVPLAELRDPSGPQAGARYPDGQSWELPYHLQRMGRGMRVARTSSQDSGVDTQADIITATASLEVGFNDPRVGAVLQHKAPRDLASFLQRRGRAGRQLDMRPITAVVLSDFGRDRIAYQSYERLLDPEIDARSLPVNNRYVIKIQATHALVDWLARMTGTDTRAALAPMRYGGSHTATHALAALADRLITDPQLQTQLAEHLQRALRLTDDEATSAMWEEPRSLMLSVLPTILRRLESNWTTIPGDTDPGARPGTPLPEYMTDALFDSLNTPDVEFELPLNFPDEHASMPIIQALRDAVPGKVSRRFGHGHQTHRTWLPTPDEGNDLELTQVIARGHHMGTWTTADRQAYFVVRPLALRLTSPPPEIADTSTAEPTWRSTFAFAAEAGVTADIPTPSAWSRLFTRCAFALHVTGGPLTVRRLTIGSDGELTRSGPRGVTRVPLTVRYAHNGQPAALGVELEVDAMVLSGRLDESWTDGAQAVLLSPAWRTQTFRRHVAEDGRLDGIANSFQRRWLCEVYLHSFVALALTGTPPNDAIERLRAGAWARNLNEFISVAYRTADPDLETTTRIIIDLENLSREAEVQTTVEEHGRLLAATAPREVIGPLTDRVLLDTLANAVLTAADESLPDANEQDLAVDVDFDNETRNFRIYLSETSIGGLGLIETLHRNYVLDPRRFWDAVRNASAPTEAEDVDQAIQQWVADAVDPAKTTPQRIASFRSARSIADMDAALAGLVGEWSESAGQPSHLLVSTFATRFLRPGSSPSIDQIVHNVAEAWVREEHRIGVEIDVRSLAFHAARGDLGFDVLPLTADALYSLLWVRGSDARAQGLTHWHPYRRDVIVERLLLERLIHEETRTVDVSHPAWLDEYVAAVESDGRVVLGTNYRDRARLAEALREATVTPIERLGLRVYCRLTAVTVRHRHIQATLALTEDLQ